DQATGQLDAGSFNSVLPANFSALAITASTGLVSVGTIGSNVVNAAAIATDAVTKIQNGLLTSTAFTAALPTNFADLAITVTDGRVDIGHVAGTELTAPHAGGNFATFFEN